MRPKVVIAYAGLGDTAIEAEVLRAVDADVVATDGLATAEARATAREADALMVTVQPVPADLVAELDRCRIVCRAGTGVDAIAIPAATERGIWVTNVPDYAVDEVSTHAIALVLAQARNLFRHGDLVRAGEWRYQSEHPIRRFAGLTLGVLGLGRIGRAAATKGLGLGLRVVAYDPYLSDADFVAVGARRVDWQTLLRESDFLTLHVPLTDETRGMVDAAALALMKPTAYLVNTARGEVVDVDALVDAVGAGRIAGAALDVLPVEPPPADAPVLHDDRIIVTPHIAWASVEAARDVKRRGAEDVVRALRGERPKYPCNEVGSSGAGAPR